MCTVLSEKLSVTFENGTFRDVLLRRYVDASSSVEIWNFYNACLAYQLMGYDVTEGQFQWQAKTLILCQVQSIEPFMNVLSREPQVSEK